MNISPINTYDSDLLLRIQLICERRQKVFNKIENIAFGWRLAFGLANNTVLLPAIANTFYFIEQLHYSVSVAQVTAGIILEFTNATGGSAGVNGFGTALGLGSSGITSNIETDSLIYLVNGNTVGVVHTDGIAFKITVE